MKPGLTGFKRIAAASKNSAKGVRDAWIHESAFRQDVAISTIFLTLSFFVADTLIEWLVLIIPLFLLIIVEILNSAIENTVDRFGGEHHILSGRAKDMASAAVMFCLILAAIVWFSMIWSKYIA